MNKFNVTVIILTYNSDYEKTIKTVTSVLNQENCTFEIIISDDGSAFNNFENITVYFEKCLFKNYTLLGDGINRGTVSNLYNALKHASGKYIKPISPGDYLYSNTTLYDMMSFMVSQNARACFGKAVFYLNKNENYSVMPYTRHPYFIKPYIKQNKRNNYFIAYDPILGAAVLYEKENLEVSLKRFNGNVKYCEDYSVLNLMTAENKRIVYLTKPVVFYESNTGISTSRNDKWTKAILKDNEYVFSYLLNEGLITKKEYYEFCPANMKQKITFIFHLGVFNFLKRKIDIRRKVIKKMPNILLRQMKNITHLDLDVIRTIPSVVEK